MEARYSREQPPDRAELRALVREFIEDENAIFTGTGRDQLRLTVLHVAPLKPHIGVIVYADGTNWNPGAGEGYYGYTSAGWAKLG